SRFAEIPSTDYALASPSRQHLPLISWMVTRSDAAPTLLPYTCAHERIPSRRRPSMNQYPTVIIGAGPYGLAVAAHLKGRGIEPLIWGKPMEFGGNMPATMHLKSSLSAISISDPSRRYTVYRYLDSLGIPRQEPVPLQLFLDYAQWFQRQVALDVDQTFVRTLMRDGQDFVLDLEDGRTLKPSHVILATGIAAFAHFPDYTRNLPPALVSHAQAHRDFSGSRDQRVAVVGSGQSALETAA